jgi:hypothetical protein
LLVAQVIAVLEQMDRMPRRSASKN